MEVGLKFERLHSLPPLDALLAESEQEGWKLVRRLVDDWESGANRFDRPGEAFFAAFADGGVAGVCGLNVDPYVQDPAVGRVRRLYVLRSFRRRGVGRRLVDAVVDAARGGFRFLRLRTANPAAARLYESMGFRRVAADEQTTHQMEL